MASPRAVVSTCTFAIGITFVPSPFATLLTAAVEAQSHEPACAASRIAKAMSSPMRHAETGPIRVMFRTAPIQDETCASPRNRRREAGAAGAQGPAGASATGLPVVSGREAELLHLPPERDRADVERLCRL